MKHTYIIPGDPIAWKRPGGKNVRYDLQKDLKLAWGIYLRNQHNGQLFSGPLHLDVLFAMPISQKLSVSKRKLVHGTYHPKRPDLSNLLKLIEDTAIGILYHDDALICETHMSKRYDLNPRTEFTLTVLE